jgi:hypothetical protein
VDIKQWPLSTFSFQARRLETVKSVLTTCRPHRTQFLLQTSQVKHMSIGNNTGEALVRTMIEGTCSPRPGCLGGSWEQQ